MSFILEICYLVLLGVICVNLPATLLKIDTVWAFIKILSIPTEEYFFETAVSCTATYFIKILGCSRWFCNRPPPVIWGSVLFYLQLPKGGFCSISDDLSCSCAWFLLQHCTDHSFSVCTLTNKAVGTIWRALYKLPQRRQCPDPRPLWVLVKTPSAFGLQLAYRLLVAQPTLMDAPIYF